MKKALQNVSNADFAAGELLLIDKPKDWTSFDVVNKLRFRLRQITGIKRIKVGHSGTLDPKATGLLQICTGKMTKQIEQLQGLDKTYTGTLKLGATTPSLDAETDESQQFPIDHITEELLDQARRKFLGNIEQIPPMYSAIKVDGQPLYKLARKGVQKEINPRPVHIAEFKLININLPEVKFLVSCSKGTYIRSLAGDFGKAVQSGAYLTALTRTRIGNYHLKDAWNLDQLIEQLELRIKEGGNPNESPPPSSQ